MWETARFRQSMIQVQWERDNRSERGEGAGEGGWGEVETSSGSRVYFGVQRVIWREDGGTYGSQVS